MTELSFSIRFPKFNTPSRTVTFKPGIHIIYGESGVGKTDLCRSLVFSQKLPGKRSFVLDQLSPNQRRILVFQDPDNQIVAPTIYRELAFNLENMGWTSKQISTEIEKIVSKYNLNWDLDRHPNTLSGGEKEILNLVTSISVYPDVLVLDDSLGFLSDRNKRNVIDILKDYCKKKNAIVVWTTSDISDIQYDESPMELRLDQFTSNIEIVRLITNDVSFLPGKILLEFKQFSFFYEKTNPVFFDQNLILGPFRSLAILGENGSGKTTIGHLLVDLLKTSGGGISLFFEDGTIPKSGFLPQTPERFFSGFTFSEIVEELIRNELFQKQEEPELRRSLGNFDISWDLIFDKPIHTLRISVTRVVLIVIIFLADYDMVILDEPMFSLGEKQKKKLKGFIRHFIQRKHLILISHSPSAPEELCDLTLHIKDGQIIKLD